MIINFIHKKSNRKISLDYIKENLDKIVEFYNT